MRAIQFPITHDADEIRRSPVKGETLLEFIERQNRADYNAIDHTVQVYKQLPEWSDDDVDPEEAFTEKWPDHIDQHNGQVKCWKQPDVPVDLASTGGHRVSFPGIRVKGREE